MEEKRVSSNKDLLRLENKYTNDDMIEDGEGNLDHRALKIKSLFADKKQEEVKKKPNFFKIGKPKCSYSIIS